MAYEFHNVNPETGQSRKMFDLAGTLIIGRGTDVPKGQLDLSGDDSVSRLHAAIGIDTEGKLRAIDILSGGGTHVGSKLNKKFTQIKPPDISDLDEPQTTEQKRNILKTIILNNLDFLKRNGKKIKFGDFIRIGSHTFTVIDTAPKPSLPSRFAKQIGKLLKRGRIEKSSSPDPDETQVIRTRPKK